MMSSRGQPLQLVSHGGVTTIGVKAWPKADATYVVHSANCVSGPKHSYWPRALGDALRQRSRDGGIEKGRVLYCYRGPVLFQDAIAVGALIYHLADSRIRVTRLGSAAFVPGAERDRVFTWLLACSQRLAELQGAQALEWLVFDERSAHAACKRFEFTRCRKRDQRCTRLHAGEILLERRQ